MKHLPLRRWQMTAPIPRAGTLIVITMLFILTSKEDYTKNKKKNLKKAKQTRNKSKINKTKSTKQFLLIRHVGTCFVSDQIFIHD